MARNLPRRVKSATLPVPAASAAAFGIPSKAVDAAKQPFRFRMTRHAKERFRRTTRSAGGEETQVYAIAFFGILMILLSIVMVVDPDYWSDGIVKFSQTKYFHGFEIISRLGFGAIFIAFSSQTLYPAVIGGFGYLLVAVGGGLLIAGPSRHRLFAVWAANTFKKTFRRAGFVSIVLGVFIAYAALVDR